MASGGLTTNTNYYAFDVDASGNIAIGGASGETAVYPGMVGTGAIVDFVQSTGGYLWQNSYAHATYLYHAVDAVKFNPAGTQIVMIFDKSGATLPPMGIVLISPADGSVLLAVVDNFSITHSSTQYPLSILWDPTIPNLAYFSSSIASTWNLFSLSLTTPYSTPIAPGFFIKSTVGFGSGGALTLSFDPSSSSALIVGGTSFNSTSLQYNTGMAARYTTAGVFSWAVYTYQPVAININLHQIDFYQNAADYSMWTCGSWNNATSKYAFMQVQTINGAATPDITTNIAGIYSGVNYQCINIKPFATNQAYALVTGLASPYYGLLIQLNSGSGTLIGYSYNFNNKFTLYMPLAHGIFSADASILYFAGITNKFLLGGGTVSQSFIKPIGFIMKAETANGTNYTEQCTQLVTIYDATTNVVTAVPATFQVVTAYTYLAAVTTNRYSQVTLSIIAAVSTAQLKYVCNPNAALILPEVANSALEITTGTGTTSYTVSAFTLTSNPVCTTAITYSYTQSPASPALADSSSNMVFSWNTATAVNVYTITFTGNLANGYTNSVPFTVTVYSENTCTSAAITVTTMMTINYYITYVQRNYTFTAFTVIPSSCPISYYITTNTGSLTAFPNTVIVMQDSFNPVVLIGPTSDTTLISNNPLWMNAIIVGTTVHVHQVFTVNIKPECAGESISISTIGSVTYDVGSFITYTHIMNWVTSDPNCPPIYYYPQWANGTNITGTLFTTDNTVQPAIFKIYSTSALDVGTFTLKVAGCSGNNPVYSCQGSAATVTITSVCSTLVFTPPAIATQNYFIGCGTTLTIPFTQFGLSLSYCGTPSYTATAQGSGGSAIALNTSLIQLDPIALKFYVVSADVTLVAQSPFTIVLTATLPNMLSSTQTFTITLTSCSSATLTPSISTIPNQSLYVFQAAIAVQVPSVTSTGATANCGTWSYVVAITGGGTSFNTSSTLLSPFSWVAANTTLLIASASESDMNYSPFTVNVYVYQGTLASHAQQFTFTVTLACNCATYESIASSPITSYTGYSIHPGTPVIITNLAWTQWMPVNCPFTYTLIDTSTNLAADSTVFQILPNNSIQLGTTDFTKARTYNLKVVATVNSATSVTASVTFSVTFADVCFGTPITTSTIANQTYTIGNAAVTILIPSWTESTGTCGIFTYTLMQSVFDGSGNYVVASQTALDSGIFSYSTQVLTVYSISVSEVGVYAIKITGTLTSGTSATYVFKVTVSLDPCTYALISTTTPLGATTVAVFQPAATITFPTYSSNVSDSTCGTTTYSIQVMPNGGSYTSTLPSPLFSWASNVLTVTSTNPTTDLTSSPYTFRVTIQQGTYTTQAISPTFTVVININCNYDTITPVAIPNYSSYTIYPGSAVILATLSWTHTLSTQCSSITYTLLDTSTSTTADTTVFQIVSGNILQIQTSDWTKAKTYNLQVVGAIPSSTVTATESFQVTFDNVCNGVSITPSTVAYQTYIIGNSPQTFSFLSWTETTGTCGSFTYTVQQSTFDGSNQYITASQTSLDASMITYSSQSFTVSTSSVSKAGIYAFQITGTLGSGTFSTEVFKLAIVDPCLTVTFSGTSVSDQTISVDQGTQTITIPSYTSSISDSICGTTTYLISVTPSGGFATTTLPSPLFTWVASPPALSVSSTNAATDMAGSPYAFTITVQQGTYSAQAVTETFTVTININCNYDQITATPISNYNSYSIYPGSAIILANLAWTQLLSSSCPIIYTLIDTSTSTTADTLVFQILPNNSIQIQTSDYTKARTYNIKVVGSIATYTPIASETFTVTFADVCIGTPITVATISNQTYTVDTSTLTFSFTSWTESTGTCGAFIYTVQQSTFNLLGQYDTSVQTSLDTTLITYSSQQFSVYSTSISKAGVYGIQVTGTLASGSFSSTVFKLTVVDPCLTATFTYSGTQPTGQTIFVYESTQTVQIPTYTSRVSDTLCGTTTYSVQVTPSGRSITSILPSPLFSWNSATLSLSISSTDPVNDPTGSPYAFSVSIQQGTYSTQAVSLGFSVIIQVSCTYDQITSSAIANYPNYNIYTTSGITTIVPALTWTHRLPGCPAIAYTLIDTSTSTTADAIFQIQSDNSITIRTQSPAKSRTYNLKVIGTIPGFSVTSSQTFQVTFADMCAQATITPSSTLGQSYIIGAAPLAITFLDWAESTGLCGPFTYTAMQSVFDGSHNYVTASQTPLDSTMITLNSATRTFSVDTSNAAKAGVYAIEIIGSISNGTIVNTYDYVFSLTLVAPTVSSSCIVTSLVPSTIDIVHGVNPATTISYEYIIGQGLLAIQIQDFTQTSDCLYPVAYSLSLQGSGYLPSFISLSLAPTSVLIASNSRQDGLVSNLVIILTAEVTNPDNSKTSSQLLIPLSVKIPDSGPPYFNKNLQDITVPINSTYQLVFPSMSCPDTYNTPSLSKIQFGLAQIFVVGVFPKYRVKPMMGEGSYPVKVTLTDDNPTPLSATYTFNIIVTSSLQNSTSANQNGTTNSSTNSSTNASSTTINITAMNSSNGGPIQIKKPSHSNVTMKPYIYLITQSGVVTIVFGSSILVPYNLSSFNESQIDVVVIPGINSDPSELNITTWIVTNIQSQYMHIAITFQNPIMISSHQVITLQLINLQIMDQLQVTFKNPNLFLQPLIPFSPIELSYNQISHVIPRQLSQDGMLFVLNHFIAATATLSASQQTVTASVNTVMYGNLAVNIIMSASLQMLWGMINVMQLVVNMPLLNLLFPANAILFYNFIVNVSNFNVIPTAWIQNILNAMTQTSAAQQFESMGFSSTNIFQNLTSILTYVAAVLGLIILVQNLGLIIDRYSS